MKVGEIERREVLTVEPDAGVGEYRHLSTGLDELAGVNRVASPE